MLDPLQTRIPALDYLRGLTALSILLFHYQKWTTGIWYPNSLLGKLGVYGVSIFFVLSGLTLGLVYGGGRLVGGKAKITILMYAKKRVFRIFPLLWLATTATLLLDARHTWSWQDILLNYTGLFGFFHPAGDIALGAWSIGNELVFYCFFPLLLWIGEGRFRWVLGLVWAFSVGLGIYFAFWRLLAGLPAHEQWGDYVSPLNNAFFFVSGVMMAVFWEQKNNDKHYPTP